MDDKQVYEFRKNSMETIRASIKQFRGNAYFDLRVFVATEGEIVPTKKGLTLSLDLLPELKKAIEAIEREAPKARASGEGGRSAGERRVKSALPVRAETE